MEMLRHKIVAGTARRLIVIGHIKDTEALGGKRPQQLDNHSYRSSHGRCAIYIEIVNKAIMLSILGSKGFLLWNSAPP